MSDLFTALIAAACAYPIFWLHSFDAEYHVWIYKSHDVDGASTLEVDDRPSLFSFPAAVWAAAFAGLYIFSAEHCTLEHMFPLTIDSAVGVLCVAATAKVLLGAAVVNHKRMLLSADRQKLTRPLPWRFLDVVTPIPVNALTVPFTKLVWFAIFGTATWVLNGFTVEESGSLIPNYAFVAGALLVGARLSNMYLSRSKLPLNALLGGKLRRPFRGAALAAVAALSLLSFLLTTSLLEEPLLRCGAIPNSLPSYAMLLAGFASMPLLTLIGTTVTAVAVSIASSEAGS